MSNNTSRHEPRGDKKLLYRRRIGVTWLRCYGIERGDTAIIVFDGDVKPGDLGYFDIDGYDRLSFVNKGDRQCRQFTEAGNVPTVCLREAHEASQSDCRGIHQGSPYGRVISIEHKGQPVEHSLTFRPFDERQSLLLRELNTLPSRTAPSEPDKPKTEKGRRFIEKAARIVLKQLETLDPKFSFTADGRLRITTSPNGGDRR